MVSRYEKRSKERYKSDNKWYQKIIKKPINKDDHYIESYKFDNDTKFVTTLCILFFFVILGVWVWVLSQVYF